MRHTAFLRSAGLWAALIFLVLGGAGCSSGSVAQPPAGPAGFFYRGVDLSFSPEMAAAGVVFTEAGAPTTPLATARRNGANLVRVRLWHAPASGHSGLPEVISLARQVKQAGLALLLDIHYADSWADPGQQPTPQAWRTLSAPVLNDSVYRYTRRVLQVLRAAQALPDLVQIGNEINGGMLWPQGRVQSAADFPALVALLNSGLRAVADEDPAHQIRTVLHFAGPAGASSFFGQLARYQVAYDVQGLSYYPQYHGRRLPDLEQQLTALVAQFDKDVLLVETAYPFTLGWHDQTTNVLGLPEQLAEGYEATPAGQLAFLRELRRQLLALPRGRGLGFCYWAPEWVARPAPNGSSWENQALFDFSQASLPAWQAFGSQ